ARETSENTLGGFTGGFFLHVPLSKQLTFRPELYYTRKGTKEKTFFAGTPYISKIRLDYFELPLNLLYTHTNAKGSFYIGGGPFIALLSTPQYGFYSTSYKSTDGGINLLTSFEIPIGFSFNINYSYSLANISDNSTTIKTWKNRSLGINIGYRF
ncbi:MAG: outer membrane beta-barrel protein, partial [Sphingobacteriales bacterium]